MQASTTRLKGVENMPFVWSLVQGHESYDLLKLECGKIDEFLKILKNHELNKLEKFEKILKFIATFVGDQNCTNLVRGLGACSSKK